MIGRYNSVQSFKGCKHYKITNIKVKIFSYWNPRQNIMSTQMESYNQKLNKIYENPYSYAHLSQNHLSIRNHQRLKSELLITSIQSQSQIQENGDIHHFGSDNHLNSMNRGNWIRVTDIIGKQEANTNSKMEESKQNGPVVNYFVTEFERLQQQNKILQQKLNTQSLTSTYNAKIEQKSLIETHLRSQNSQLKKQLEDQKLRNHHKNQQIAELLGKITQIESHLEYVAKSKLQQAEKIRDQEAEIKQKYETLQQQRKIQFEALKNQYNNLVISHINPLVDRIRELEQLLGETRKKYKELQEKVTYNK